MIRKVKDEFVAQCSECGTHAYGGCEDDFRAFVDAIKADGWQVRKDDDVEWLHICPDCQD